MARLDDARFYWDTDLKHTPAERVEALASVVWMEGLGSLREKAARLQALGGWLALALSIAAIGFGVWRPRFSDPPRRAGASEHGAAMNGEELEDAPVR